METKCLNLNGFKIEVLDMGCGTNGTLLFAHGLGSNLRQFEPQINFFKDNYRVIAYSLQGHGDSDHPEDANSYTIQAYTQTILALFEVLNIDACIWVGNSMGGVLGYEVLKQQPEKIKLLITNGTTPELIYGKSMLKMIYLMDILLIKILKFEGYIRLAAKNSSKDKDLTDKIYGFMIKTAPQAVISSHQVLGSYSYLQQVINPPCPIVIIRCPYDHDINSSLKKVMKHIIGNKKVEVIELPEAGHLANIERPEAYSKIIANAIHKYL